jgi:hypothetical protein
MISAGQLGRTKLLPGRVRGPVLIPQSHIDKFIRTADVDETPIATPPVLVVAPAKKTPKFKNIAPF